MLSGRHGARVVKPDKASSALGAASRGSSRLSAARVHLRWPAGRSCSLMIFLPPARPYGSPRGSLKNAAPGKSTRSAWECALNGLKESSIGIRADSLSSRGFQLKLGSEKLNDLSHGGRRAVTVAQE